MKWLVLAIVCLVILFLSLLFNRKTENFETTPSIPVDADNPNILDTQLYGEVSQYASASIYIKKEAQNFANNIDAATVDPKTGGILFDSSQISLSPGADDVQVALNVAASTRKSGFKDYDGSTEGYRNKMYDEYPLEGFESAKQEAALLASTPAADAAKDQVKGEIESRAKKLVGKTKLGRTVQQFVAKTVTRVTTKISTKMGNRFGSKLINKIMVKVTAKISELIGKKIALATVTTGTLSSNPITAALGIMLGVITATAISLQTYMTVTLKGEDGFCPTGWAILGGQIPSFLSNIPGIGDILGTMGPYLCYRNECLPTEEDGGAGLCYPKCDPGYHGVGPVCWANSNPSNSVTPSKKGCSQMNQGWARCRDDGTSLWEDWQCNTSWDGCCSRGLFGECYGCARTNCNGCGCIKVTQMDRQYCPDPNRELAYTLSRVDQQCFSKCPADTPYRVPAVPTQCSAASRVGDGKGGTSYGRGVGTPKLKMQIVSPPPAEPAPPPAGTSSAYAVTPSTCTVDYSSTAMLSEMCKFYYLNAALYPTTNTDSTFSIVYISKITKIAVSSEQSCDVLCDVTTRKIHSTTKAIVSSQVTTNSDRRFYFAKITSHPILTDLCFFVPTGCTNVKGLAPDLYLPDSSVITVSYVYTPT